MDEISMPISFKQGDQYLSATNRILMRRYFPPEETEELNRKLELAAREGISAEKQDSYWQTPGTWLNGSTDCIQALRKRITEAIDHYLVNVYNRNHSSIDGRTLPADYKHKIELWGWAGGSVSEANNPPHVHRNSHLSGIYYIKGISPGEVDPVDYSGCVVFILSDGAEEVVMGSYAAPHHLPVHPLPGLLLVFPSYLRHFVNRFRFRKFERLYVSFNCRFDTAPEVMSDPSRRR